MDKSITYVLGTEHVRKMSLYILSRICIHMGIHTHARMYTYADAYSSVRMCVWKCLHASTDVLHVRACVHMIYFPAMNVWRD